MIADWDLWPFRVAEGAGETVLWTYRLQRNVDAASAELARRLYPAIRPVVIELRKFTKALQ